MKPGGLVGLLAQSVVAGDINACCGILRRIYCEALHEADSVAVTSRRDMCWSPRPDASSLSTSRVSAALSTAPASATKTTFTRNNTNTSTNTQKIANSSSISHISSTAASGSESLVDRVLSLGRACLADNPTLVRPSSVSVLCHAAQRHQQWQAALHFCAHLPTPASPVFLASLLTPGNAEAVATRCEEAGWPVDVPSAIRVLAQEHGNWAAALAAAQRAERRFPSGEPYSVGVLIPHLAASGEGGQAIALFESCLARGSLVEPALVQQLLMQTAELQQWETCLRMLDIMARMQEACLLLPRSADFFRRLVEASPSWQVSLHFFEAARAADVKPDRRTVGILVAQCDAVGAWREATRVYDAAVRDGFADSLADGRTYHALVRSFTAVRQWEKALEALSWMAKASDASLAAGTSELVELCERAGQWEAALSIGKGLLADSPEVLTEQTALAILFACAKGAQWELATRLYTERLRDVRTRAHPLALCAVLQACAEASRWQEALCVLEAARAEQPRTVVPPMAHRLAVKACVRAGEWSHVLAALDAMRADGLPKDNHSQRFGLWAAALTGQWELSLEYLQRIPLRARTPHDRMVIRAATRRVGPSADATALRVLQGITSGDVEYARWKND